MKTLCAPPSPEPFTTRESLPAAALHADLAQDSADLIRATEELEDVVPALAQQLEAAGGEASEQAGHAERIVAPRAIDLDDRIAVQGDRRERRSTDVAANSLGRIDSTRGEIDACRGNRQIVRARQLHRRLAGSLDVHPFGIAERYGARVRNGRIAHRQRARTGRIDGSIRDRSNHCRRIGVRAAVVSDSHAIGHRVACRVKDVKYVITSQAIEVQSRLAIDPNRRERRR